ncbi:MAG: hydroxylamine reductase [Polyangia bacterium]|jgi:hydroxylamine reductase
MFCNQCEQFGRSCATTGPGVCGKDPDIQSLQEIILFGLKGMAAYAHHARRLGMVDESVSAFIEEALFSTLTNVNFDGGVLFDYAMALGRTNLRVMQMLDEGHVRRFGKPSPTEVTEGTLAGPGILVTGHDLVDLDDLLAQCRGTEVKVYTHGEMLPAHMYPALRGHPNLAGHFGGAWQDQRREFAAFSGPVLATTNCVVIPPPSYADRLFTTRATAVPGGRRIVDRDFSAVIAQARAGKPLVASSVKKSTVGFHHSAILALAPTIVDAVKAGKISRLFVIGGCDGAESGRNYFSEYAKLTPPDSFILTLGCGKFRIRQHDFGTHLGLPRLLDMGQCNDAYGAVQVAVALAGAFGCTVNDLPLTLVVSWFEQKAVAVLLSLLALGIKKIAIGPNPPAFVTPGVFKVLQDKFDLRLTSGEPERDLAAALAG